jgi:hypothetical protein
MMQTQEQLKTAQDYLDAADREFENGNAVAGTERLWDAITHTLTAIADAKGWSYDAGDLFPVVQKLAERDEQVSYILEGIYAAAEGHPGLVRAEYFRFEYGDTHQAGRLAREFIDTILALAAQSDKAAWSYRGTMQTQKYSKAVQDYLDAADREFENADALAATENLWAAITHTLKAVADQKGWEYDTNHLFPVVEKLADLNGQDDDILQSSYLAAKSFPNKVHYGYFVWEDGDSHWMRRVTHEFIAAVQELAGRSQ